MQGGYHIEDGKVHQDENDEEHNLLPFQWPLPPEILALNETIDLPERVTFRELADVKKDSLIRIGTLVYRLTKVNKQYNTEFAKKDHLAREFRIVSYEELPEDETLRRTRSKLPFEYRKLTDELTALDDIEKLYPRARDVSIVAGYLSMLRLSGAKVPDFTVPEHKYTIRHRQRGTRRSSSVVVTIRAGQYSILRYAQEFRNQLDGSFAVQLESSSQIYITAPYTISVTTTYDVANMRVADKILNLILPIDNDFLYLSEVTQMPVEFVKETSRYKSTFYIDTFQTKAFFHHPGPSYPRYWSPIPTIYGEGKASTYLHHIVALARQLNQESIGLIDAAIQRSLVAGTCDAKALATIQNLIGEHFSLLQEVQDEYLSKKVEKVQPSERIFYQVYSLSLWNLLQGLEPFYTRTLGLRSLYVTRPDPAGLVAADVDVFPVLKPLQEACSGCTLENLSVDLLKVFDVFYKALMQEAEQTVLLQIQPKIWPRTMSLSSALTLLHGFIFGPVHPESTLLSRPGFAITVNAGRCSINGQLHTSCIPAYLSLLACESFRSTEDSFYNEQFGTARPVAFLQKEKLEPRRIYLFQDFLLALVRHIVSTKDLVFPAAYHSRDQFNITRNNAFLLTREKVKPLGTPRGNLGQYWYTVVYKYFSPFRGLLLFQSSLEDVLTYLNDKVPDQMTMQDIQSKDTVNDAYGAYTVGQLLDRIRRKQRVAEAQAAPEVVPQQEAPELPVPENQQELEELLELQEFDYTSFFKEARPVRPRPVLNQYASYDAFF